MEAQTGYGRFDPYLQPVFSDRDYIFIEKWGLGYTAVVSINGNEKKYFNSDLDALWQDVRAAWMKEVEN